MPTIRLVRSGIEVGHENGVRETLLDSATEEALAAFDRSEAERLRGHVRRWPRRLLLSFGFLSIAIYLISVWAEARP